jgi:hypothetical protein
LIKKIDDGKTLIDVKKLIDKELNLIRTEENTKMNVLMSKSQEKKEIKFINQTKKVNCMK